jgi:creatinine amidohydrolase
MTREVRMEYMRPHQLIEARNERSVAYLPVSPIEWHGPHNPVGVDGLHAYKTALEVARRFGGVVMPPLYAGLGGQMDDETLKNIGFTEPLPVVYGMDFPKNSVPSMYWDEDIYHLTVKEHIRQMIKYQYRLIVTVANHGDLRLVAKEMTEAYGITVVHASCIGKKFDDTHDHGHATLGEGAIVVYLLGEYVDFSQLPSKKEVPYLKSVDYGIADEGTFRGSPNPDHIIEKDPRDATPELGKEFFESGVKQVLEIVEAAYFQVLQS